MKTATRERPILFSGPMVRAILDGRKTVTRRIVKPQTYPLATPDMKACHWKDDLWVFGVLANAGVGDVWRCPFGVPGDRLWVRETFCWKRDPITAKLDCGFWYAATDDTPSATDDDGFQKYRKDGTEASPWISGLRMPREASRLTLEVVSVRVERLQEISIADIAAEGVVKLDSAAQYIRSTMSQDQRDANTRHLFSLAWDSLHLSSAQVRKARAPLGSWDANPWVWRIEFRRLQ